MGTWGRIERLITWKNLELTEIIGGLIVVYYDILWFTYGSLCATMGLDALTTRILVEM